ncbi:uncharacterized protein CFAP97D2 [Phascolarctos cinereus]|uniref:Cilia- and flagella-associated protein 97 n=1 Tax=Phascolarctos cinereus TaxID=38626 RepID=A0A6P5IQ98_PHACI|nr:trichohyalin [Phascolarctos cinereus]
MKVCVKVISLCEEVHGPIKQFEMHRSYHPMFNYCENIFNQKSWERAYKDHRRKVENAKAVVDCSPPLIYNHIQLNLKKFKKETERLRFIERENRWLMERIAFIMRTHNTCDFLNDYRQRWARRERELQRIDRENRSFQERFASYLSWYPLQRCCEDWEVEENFSDSTTEIPQTCCCSHLVHEIRPRRITPRKRLLKLRQRRVEDWDSDMEDEVISEDIKQKQDDMNEKNNINEMEDKTKLSTPEKEEDMISKLIKEEEKRKYKLVQEEIQEIGFRLLEDVKSRVAKLEVELETESKMLQEVKTLIKMKEEEEVNQLQKKEPKVRKSILKEKAGRKFKTRKDIESKAIEDTESKAIEDTESKAIEVTESKAIEDTESKAIEDTESKPIEDTESKPKKEKEQKPRVTIVEVTEDMELKPREGRETKKVTLQEPEKELQDKPPEEEEAVTNAAVKEEDAEDIVLEGKESQPSKALQEEQKDVS